MNNKEDMTPTQRIKELIISDVISDSENRLMGRDIGKVSGDDVDEYYDELRASPDYRCEIAEAKYNNREGISTGLYCKEYSRHYESEIVAVKVLDGSYVAWIYWSGGGKHGEPEEIDWMEDAFFVDCEEKQEMVTTTTFSERTIK